LTTDPLALARLLMGGQPQTAGTAFEPVTWQQQLQNYKQLEGQEQAWQTAQGSPWKPAEPGPVAKAIGNALTSQTGQRLMDLANFLGPGPKMPMRAMAPEGPKGIKAYHGSPHDFDRFDLSKIGSGEGAQAFGHGLYFAEAEAVAKQYRDMLGNYADSVKWKGPQPPNELQQSILKQLAGADASGQMMTLDKLKREAIQTRRAAADYDDEGNMIPGTGPNAKEFARQTALIEELQRSADLIDVKPPGRMYEVNIKADPDQFLDWDVPLAQQPKKVQEIWEQFKPPPAEVDAFGFSKAVASARDVPENPAGGDILNYLRNEAGAEAVLRESGVPGIRYKDAMSRGAEGGTSNYVVFDDKLIDIVKKYGLAALLMGGATGGGSNSGNAAP
jgi:hypothetical protein